MRKAAAKRKASGGGDKKSAAAKAKSVSQQIDEAIRTDQNANRTDSKLAKLNGTNRQYVNDSRKLADESPELFEEVKQGKKTIPQAMSEVRKGKKRAELEQKAADAGRRRWDSAPRSLRGLQH